MGELCNALLDAKSPLSFLSISGNDIGAESIEGVKRVAALISSINDSIVSFSASENEMNSNGFPTTIVTKLNDTFGEKLREMDDNIDDEDYDDDLDPEELDDDLGIDREEDEVQENLDTDVDNLADAFNKVVVSNRKKTA